MLSASHPAVQPNSIDCTVEVKNMTITQCFLACIVDVDTVEQVVDGIVNCPMVRKLQGVQV